MPKALTSLPPRSCTSQTQAGVAQAGGFLTETQTCVGLFYNEPSLCVSPQVLFQHLQPLHMLEHQSRKEVCLFFPLARFCVCTCAIHAFDRGNDSLLSSKVGVRAASVGEGNQGEEAGWDEVGTGGWVCPAEPPPTLRSPDGNYPIPGSHSSPVSQRQSCFMMAVRCTQ